MKIHYSDNINRSPAFATVMEGLACLAKDNNLEETEITGEGYPVIYATSGSLIIGVLVYGVWSDTKVWLYLSYVKPEFRNKGIFKMLFDKLVAISKEEGYETIDSGVHESNNEFMSKLMEKTGRKPYARWYRYDVK